MPFNGRALISTVVCQQQSLVVERGVGRKSPVSFPLSRPGITIVFADNRSRALIEGGLNSGYGQSKPQIQSTMALYSRVTYWDQRYRKNV